MINTDPLRQYLLEETYNVLRIAAQDPDLTPKDAQEALQVADICLPMYEKIALIGSNSSSTWYRMHEDLPQSERDMLPKAKHYVKILRALHPTVEIPTTA